MSSSRILNRGVRTTDDLMIMFDGRGYGAFIGVEERMEQPLPTFLEPIVAEFKAQSELLKLELGAELDHDQIFDAYRLDVQFLQERCDGFKDMVKWSVKASMKAGDGDDAKAWDTIKDGIPLMDSVLLINLNADRAALPADRHRPVVAACLPLARYARRAGVCRSGTLHGADDRPLLLLPSASHFG